MTFRMFLTFCYNSTSQVHITYAAWITACSRGPLPSEGNSLDWSQPIRQRRDWPAFTACCCGSSPSCGELPSSTTPCIMRPIWVSANCSAISLASCRTLLYAGSTASVPNGDKRTPRNQVEYNRLLTSWKDFLIINNVLNHYEFFLKNIHRFRGIQFSNFIQYYCKLNSITSAPQLI